MANGLQPRPQLLGTHPVDARGTGVALDASERLGKVLAGQQLLPQRTRLGGVRSGVARRRGWAVLCTAVVGLHRQTLPSRPLAGLAAFNAHPTSTSVLRLGFAFGPSQRHRSPLVLRPLLTSPRRTTSSRTPPSRTTPRTERTGHLRHPRRPPQVRPATFLAHPPRPRDGLLMTTGFAMPSWLAQTAPPPTRSPPRPSPAAMRHVFLGSRFRLRLPSHPASRRRSCPWLVVGVISSTGDSHPRAADRAGRTSGRRRAHPGAPHTTGRAGPHPAVRLASRRRR